MLLFRNEFLLKPVWIAHYRSLGMTFPSAPLNGIIWVTWGFLFAAMVFMISRKFNLARTVTIGWGMAFVMMWLVTGNLGVLPLDIMGYAIPLSLLKRLSAHVSAIKSLRPIHDPPGYDPHYPACPALDMCMSNEKVQVQMTPRRQLPPGGLFFKRLDKAVFMTYSHL